MSTERAATSVCGQVARVSAAGGNPTAARITGQRMPDAANRSFAASLIAAMIVAIFAVGASRVTRARGACSRAAGELPIATTPGTDGRSRQAIATCGPHYVDERLLVTHAFENFDAHGKLHPGDQVLSVDRMLVSSARDIHHVIEAKPSVTVVVLRHGAVQHVAVTPIE